MLFASLPPEITNRVGEEYEIDLRTNGKTGTMIT